MKRRQFLKGVSAGVVGGMVYGSALGQEKVGAASASGGRKRKGAVVPKQFRGMMPILPSTINEDESLDLVSQRQLVRYCLECGSVAIGHMGIASEFFKLTKSDRQQYIETVIDEVNGRVPVFVGVTGASARLAEEYAKEAVAMGADVLMVATPFVTMPDLKETKEYYRRVCGAVEVPIILQDTSASENVVTAEVMVELSEELPNLRYVKAEGRKFLTKTARLFELQKQGAKIDVIGGAGGRDMIYMLREGVTSFMTGTEAQDVHAAVVKAYLDGEKEKAAKLFYEEVVPYLAFYSLNGERLLKEMLHRRGIIRCPKVIPPANPTTLSAAERKEFEWVLSRMKWRTDWTSVVKG